MAKVLFGFYKGNDVVGRISEDGTRLERIMIIEDREYMTEDGMGYEVVPVLKPFRSVIFHDDFGKKMKWYSVNSGEVEYLQGIEDFSEETRGYIQNVIDNYLKTIEDVPVIIEEEKPRLILP